MKLKDLQDLKQKPAAELHKLLRESEHKLSGLMFDLRQGKLKNGLEVRNLRKYIARLQTFLRAAELAAVSPSINH